MSYIRVDKIRGVCLYALEFIGIGAICVGVGIIITLFVIGVIH